MNTRTALILAGSLSLLLSCCAGGGSNPGDGGGGGCTVQELFPMEQAAFTGSDLCAGVIENQVLRDSAEATAHNAAHCDTVQACSGGNCMGATGFLTGKMIVYVAGTASGCDASASIEEVRICEDEVQVDYRVLGEGACGTVVNAWASAWVDYSDLPVTFKLLE